MSSIGYPIDLVNNFIQVVSIEPGVLGSVPAVDPKSFKLLENLVDPLVGSHAMIDQFMDRLDHRIVHASAYRVGGETRFVTCLFFDDVRRNANRGGAGAKILGPITIGDGARVGSNAVVVKSVPPGARMRANSRIAAVWSRM